MNESASIRRAVAFEVEIDAVEAPGRKQCRDLSGEPRPRCRGCAAIEWRTEELSEKTVSSTRSPTA
jgi:hypothetical protein